jgi:hypothetical protein
VQLLLTTKLYAANRIKGRKMRYWQQWDDRTFFEVLQELFPSDKLRGDDEYQTTMARLNDVRLDIDFTTSHSELRYVGKVQKIFHEAGGERKFSSSERREFVKVLIGNIGARAETRTNPEQLRELHTHLRARKISKVERLLEEILRWVEPIRMMWNYGEKSGWFKAKGASKDSGNPKPTDQTARDRGRGKFKKDKPSATATDDQTPDLRGACRGCGRKGHKREACRGKAHPDYNNADCEWEDSEALKAIRASNLKDEKGNPLTTLPWNKRVDGSPYSGLKWDKPKPKKQKVKGESLCVSCHESDLLTLSRYGDERHLHTTPAVIQYAGTQKSVNILFDTGALQGNYLSEDVAGWMRQRGAIAKADSSRVCGAFNNCQITKNLFSCNLVFSRLATRLESLQENSKSVEAKRKRDADVQADSTDAGDELAGSVRSKAKRRKLSKLSALAAFERLDGGRSETPEGTSCTEALDEVHEPSQRSSTAETPEGTSRIPGKPSEAQTDVVIVELDARELEIPYDMIIGRPSICEHRLLRFDAELGMAGLETPISRISHPPLTSEEPHVAPAITV